MVDWSLARQVADLSAGADDPEAYDVDLDAICAELEGPVGEYTGLELAEPVPAPELVSRSEWASANLVSLAELLDPVAARLDDRLGFAGPLAGALRVGAAATVAAEAGLVMGYVSHRVLGQYDVSLLAGDRPARLLFVAPNLKRAVRDMGVERSGVRALDLRPRADPRLPVPGRALAARAPVLARARVPRVGGGADRPRRRRRAALDAEPEPARRDVPRGWAGRADPDARAALRDGPPAGGHGRDRGPLRARDGLARRAPDPGPRNAPRRDGTAAAARARRPSAWWSACSGWT